MKVLLAAACGAAAIFGATGAKATTIVDFTEFAHTSPGPYGAIYSSSFISKGFRFDNKLGNMSLAVLSTNHHANADPGSATLTSVFGGGTRIDRVDGGLFNLDALDFADYSNDGAAGATLQLTYFDGVTQGTRVLAFDNLRGLQTADLGLKNLLWFSIEGQAQFDNFRFGEPVSSAVPEPATWAMLILGFTGAGAAIRRQRRRTAFA